MALRNVYNQYSKDIDVPSIQTETLSVVNGPKIISHTVDPSGNYTIVNQDGQTVLQFDNNANLVDGVLLQAIIANTDEITTVANNLNTTQTTITNLQTEVDGINTTVTNMQNNGNGPQSLNSVLTIGNNAQGKNILNVNSLTVAQIDMGSVTISSNNSSLVLNGEINCSNVNTIQTYINRLKYFFSVFSQGVGIIDPNTGQQFDFSNLL